MAKNIFPNNFLWGAATASYQVEGGIENCDWAEAAREKRVPTCGEACDHYNRYKTDFDIAVSLGHNTHRFSVEWARIEPKEGEFNEAAIEHYRDVLKALHERGLTPLVTLWHFTLPQWFAESGGWERPDAYKIFTRYATHVVQELGDLCDNYATMNEPMILTGMGYLVAVWPPFYKLAFVRSVRVLLHMAKAHRMTYEFIKKKNPTKEVGIVKHTHVYDANKNILNKIRAWVANFLRMYSFMSLVYKKCDWIGLNYYKRTIFGGTRELEVTDMGWNRDPEGIYEALQLLRQYKKPIFITEAGCADAKDRFRAEYIRKTVQGIAHAIRDGVDVRGYCYWSLLDNYEWSEGFEKRFGLVEVDYETQKRIIRPSAFVYKELIDEYST